MDQSAINVRYAKAFFGLAKEKGMLAQLKTDIELVATVCAGSKDFVLLLESPIVKATKKTELIAAIFEGKINGLTSDFLKLIAKNKREVYIPGICRNFLALARKDQNIKSAMLTTASEIGAEATKKIEQLIEKELGAKIELRNKVDPSIIGGLVLRLEDKQYDASVSTQLKKVKQTLLGTELNN